MKALLYAAAAAHTFALLSAFTAAWLTYKMFESMSQGGQPEVLSMVFAIGIAVIPYCLAGTIHRLAEVQVRINHEERQP